MRRMERRLDRMKEKVDEMPYSPASVSDIPSTVEIALISLSASCAAMAFILLVSR